MTNETKKEMRSLNKVPPDGGYGWVIVFSSALSSFIILSLMQCFGLIFKDTFSELRFTAAQGSIIINLNASFGKLIGPITAIFLKMYGCRKVAFLAGFFVVAGMMLTSFSKNFGLFLVSYGVIASMGMQISESTQRLALNFYFQKKRNVAMGTTVTIAGFGPIFIPQLIRLLLKVYTPQQVTLIYGGICAHVFVAAGLLQPVKWHLKEVETTPEEGQFLEPTTVQDEVEASLCGKILKSVTKTFDLDLLKDPIFDNILLGLALATFAELNFTLLVPFILNDFGFTTDEIATFISTLGVADMTFRFLGPHIGNYFTKPSRLMNYYVLLAIAFAWGIAKGVRKVYMWLVIPDYVKVDKLPAAGGIETLANGMCILIGGPVMGALRDATGSYVTCIIVMNCVTMVTILMWSVEAVIVRSRSKRFQGGE